MGAPGCVCTVSARLCARMSECVCGTLSFVCGFLYAQDGGGWGCCAGFWMRLELCQRMDGGVFFFFFQSILLKIPIFPKGTKCALVFGFLASGRKQVRGKNGIVDQLDFTLLLLLSQVWPTQQL